MEGILQGSLPNLGQSEQQEKLCAPIPSHTGPRSLHFRRTQAKGPGEDEVLTLHQDFHGSTALLDLIKACGKEKNLSKGSRIHAHVLERGLLKHNVFVGTALLRMYAECGALAKAEEVFDKLQVRDVRSWTALIAGYAQHGLGEEALNCFGRMRDEGRFPDAVTFVYILKACGSIRAVEKGKEIHAEVDKQGLLQQNAVLGTALVDMYVKCGALAKAQEVLDRLPARDVAAWTAMIAGYAQHGLGNKALNCFGCMQDEGLSPNVVTFVCILKACGSIRAMEKGKEIHAKVQRQGLLERSIVLGTALVDMYAKCGRLAKAQAVFDELPGRDVTSWNALIAGYVQHGLGDEALSCFERMQREGLSPNRVTFLSVLKACGSIGATKKGEEIHAEAGRRGFLHRNVVLGTALVDMYAKCGLLAKSQEVFDKLPTRDVASWNALLAGYAEHGHGDEALNCFEQMGNEGLSPNIVTFLCILKACGSNGAVEKGEEIHAEVGRQGLLENNIVLGTALVDMYAKCCALTKAQEVFDELLARDVASWTALIAGYVQHGRSDEALDCFGRMQDEGLSPNAVTFVCILKACGSIGAFVKGEEIHTEVRRQGLLGKNIMLGTALVDMYANSGILAKAQEVFDELPAQDVALWNALIAGYAQLGDIESVFNSFSNMIGGCIEPNAVTFVVLLAACNHAGLVEEGQLYFDAMSTVFHIIPTSEHHTCMVDLFSRAGRLDQALSMMEKVPPSDCLLLWLALLGACGKWVNVELGSQAFEHVVQQDKNYAAVYVYMSNIYAAAGMQEQVDKVEAFRMKDGAWRIPGHCWWTDVSRNVHLFTVRGNNHPQSKFIHAKLKVISQKLRLEGYSPGLHWVSQAISDDGTEDALCGHAGKLAIACGLVNTPEGTPICFTNNMRVCGDCHIAMALISKLEK